VGSGQGLRRAAAGGPDGVGAARLRRGRGPHADLPRAEPRRRPGTRRAARRRGRGGGVPPRPAHRAHPGAGVRRRGGPLAP
ncbi:MAG: hypothetical protein AVDCRST_MAG66-4491, partial [uncultured Pseudonocardia sp.]